MFKALKDWIDKERAMPVDQLQLEAAQDRLGTRTQQIKEESDRLSEMIKRLQGPKRKCRK